MSISEHHSRTRAIRQQKYEVVFGALLGQKKDQNVIIIDSLELCMSASYELDKEFFRKRIPLINQVYPDLEIVGWYSTALPEEKHISVQDYDISMHKQMSEFVPNPILVKLNPYNRNSDPKISGSLPLKIYEPVIEVDADGEQVTLIEVCWTIVTEDVEIVGLEHNAKMTPKDATPSSAVDYLQLQYNAVKMLKDRIRVMAKFVKDVQSGILPYQEEPIADIARLVQRFPLMSSEQYTKAHNMQCNDVALNTYLGILTKGSMSKMNDIGKQGSKSRAYSSTHARR